MIDFSTFTLDNGLRVVHSHDPQTAMVTLNVLYDTGSRDESRRLTGMAHLFEHLMFGGSVNIEEFDRTLELAGGTNNAATGNDFTYFYDVLPEQNRETAFYLESDRMLGLAFSDKALEVQRSVVIEEFKQTCLNRPYGRTNHTLLPMLYPTHPYGWPVIGITPEHIARVTQDDVRRWFYSHYAPNNAIVAVVGRITLDETRRLTEKWFGPIPARDIEPRQLADDPWPTTQQRIDITDNVPQTMITMGYRMDSYGKPGFFAADAITDILAAGKSSRMYRHLVLGDDLFTSADASISGLEHEGLVIVNARITSDAPADIDRAIDRLQAELRQLAEPGNVDRRELERTKNRFEATYTFENMNSVKKAYNLALALYHCEDINDTVPRYRSLTVDDIATTARRLFVEHSPAIVVTKASNK